MLFQIQIWIVRMRLKTNAKVQNPPGQMKIQNIQQELRAKFQQRPNFQHHKIALSKSNRWLRRPRRPRPLLSKRNRQIKTRKNRKAIQTKSCPDLLLLWALGISSMKKEREQPTKILKNVSNKCDGCDQTKKIQKYHVFFISVEISNFDQFSLSLKSIRLFSLCRVSPIRVLRLSNFTCQYFDI